MTLSSLAIAIGMVVDNAIVVTDNVFRWREKGLAIKEAAVKGASEVGMAVSATTFTTVIVFLPMAFLSGITGIMFKQLAIIVTVTLLASLFTALTFTPMLCSKILTRPASHVKFMERLEHSYSRVLSWALNNKKKVILSALAVFVF